VDMRLSLPRQRNVVSSGIRRHILSLYGSTALCWTLAAFSVSPSFLHSRYDSLYGGSARCKATTYTENNHKMTSMPRVGFEPTTTVTGIKCSNHFVWLIKRRLQKIKLYGVEWGTDESELIRKEVAVTYSRYYPSLRLQGLRSTIKPRGVLSPGM
jgi:hypothetical protein